MKPVILLFSLSLLSVNASAGFRIIDGGQEKYTPMLTIIESYENEKLRAELARTRQDLNFLKATMRMDTINNNNQITVYFGFNKTQFKPSPEVATNIISLAKQAEWIGIRGYTDNIGSDQVNQQIAEKRAAAAKQYLISQGIDSNKISNYGSTDGYISPNKTAYERSFNRRAELEFTQTVLFKE